MNVFMIAYLRERLGVSFAKSTLLAARGSQKLDDLLPHGGTGWHHVAARMRNRTRVGEEIAQIT